MGHYHKKAYKKQKIHLDHSIDIKKEYIEAMTFDTDLDDDLFFSDDIQESMFDEPDIVKQLRQEEIEGKLPLFPSSEFEENNDLKTNDIIEFETVMTEFDPVPHLIKKQTVSYEQSLELARKSLKKSATKDYTTVKFQ